MSQQQAIWGTNSRILSGPWEDSRPRTLGHEPTGPSPPSFMEATFLSLHREAKHGGKCPLCHGGTLSSGSGNRKDSQATTTCEPELCLCSVVDMVTGKVQGCLVTVLGLSKLGSRELCGTSKEPQSSLEGCLTLSLHPIRSSSSYVLRALWTT